MAEDYAPNEKTEGLHQKYAVRRLTDARGKHSKCRYFVLDPQHDPIAIEALLTYATEARERGYQPLYDDLLDWLATIQAPSASGETGAPDA